MKPPGPKPQPPKLRAFTMKPPVRQESLLAWRTREQLEQEVYEELLEKMQMDVPKKPDKVVEDPGKFTLEEPRPPQKRDYGPLPDPPVKPATYDAVKFQIEELEKQADAMQPKDPRFMTRIHKPGVFDSKEPVRPVLDYPSVPVPPTYKALPGEPVPKYVFYEPELRLLSPEGIEDPGDKLPDPPRYRKEPPAKNPKEAPEVPKLRDEPSNPGGAKRFFRWLSSAWRAEIRDHDAWEREREAFPAALDRYNKDARAWKAECDRIEAEHKAWEEECKKLDADHAKAINEFAEKKAAWEEAVRELEPANLMKKMEYEAKLQDYRKAKEILGDKFDAERIAFEKQFADWEAGLDEATRAIKAENQALHDNYEKECQVFNKLEAEYDRNFAGCGKDPEKIRARRDELERQYDKELEDYKTAKDFHEKRQKTYDDHLEAIKQKAISEGRDPAAEVKDYEDHLAQYEAYEAKTVELADYIAKHPEVNKYESEQQEYEDEKTLREDAAEAEKEDEEDFQLEHGEWKAAKDEHDKKVAAFKDYDAALKKFEADEIEYERRMKDLKNEAYRETNRRIEENEREINEIYPQKAKEYETEKLAYDQAYRNWKQGVYDMEQPGGLIYKWEQKVKEYEAAKKAHEQAQKKYEEDVKTYPGRLQDYNNKLTDYLKELEKYNKRMTQYKAEKLEYEKAIQANEDALNEHRRGLFRIPAYKDYSLKSMMYINGHYQWKDRIEGSYQYNAIQATDAKEYKAEQEKIFKDFEKRKKNAPEAFSGKAGKEYTEKLQEYNYLKTQNPVMHPYLKALNAQEREFVNETNSKYKKDSDIGLNDFKKIAVEKIYYTTVRQKLENYKHTWHSFEQLPVPVDKLVDPAYAANAKKEMLANKKLMKNLEQTYKHVKDDPLLSVVRTLKKGDRLITDYEDTYHYVKGKKEAVKDPVLGEYHGSYEAIQKAMAKNPVAGK